VKEISPCGPVYYTCRTGWPACPFSHCHLKEQNLTDPSHLRILIHRNGFLRNQRARDDRDKQAATAAANQISRIAEDMLSQQTIQYGQMHL
jgi:hypothetical protein